MLLVTGVVRGAIIVAGIVLLLFGRDDTIRLFGVLAILFGGVRLYLLFRNRPAAEDEECAG
jgi:hypothetical protein